MKKAILFSILLTIVFQSQAQNNKAVLSVGIGAEHLFYNPVWSPAFGLGFYKPINNRLGASLNLGYTKGVGGYSSTSSSGSYKVEEKERIITGDLAILYSITGNDKRLNVKTGLGASFANINFVYPPEVIIEQSKIKSAIEVTSNVNSALFNVVAEADYKLGNNITIGVRGVLRRVFSKYDEHFLVRTTKYDQVISGSRASTSSGVLVNGTVEMKIGYMF
jgi:hypothetical protein